LHIQPAAFVMQKTIQIQLHTCAQRSIYCEWFKNYYLKDVVLILPVSIHHIRYGISTQLMSANSAIAIGVLVKV